MKKGFIALSAVTSVAVIAASLFALSLSKKDSLNRTGATGEKVVVWNKNTGATAKTSIGNEILLSRRYVGDWNFGGEYLAVSTSEGSCFLDNFTEQDCPFRSIKSLTFDFEATSTYYLIIKLANTYGEGKKAIVSTVESGVKYEIGVSSDIEYLNGCSSSDIFSYFAIESSNGYGHLNSVTIEYSCD